jgi:hypothetical protein
MTADGKMRYVTPKLLRTLYEIRHESVRLVVESVFDDILGMANAVNKLSVLVDKAVAQLTEALPPQDTAMEWSLAAAPEEPKP